MPGDLRSFIRTTAATVLWLASASVVEAQTGTITGRVFDARTLQPLASAQVSIPDLSIGALTQQNGLFVLENVPAGTHAISVQRIGYRTAGEAVTVAVGQTVTSEFGLSEEALALDEVIVTGTPGGTQRRAIGNAVGRMEMSEVNAQVAVPSLQQAFSGRVPGLQLNRASDNLGTGSNIRIRGISTFSLSTNPVIIVDGVRVNNSSTAGPNVGLSAWSTQSDSRGAGEVNLLNDFNPQDIESIEIIKGPAAATLYGTEASAGVIHIITKRGQTGAPQFDLSIRQGANFVTNPAEKTGTFYICTSQPDPPCPEEDLYPYNMYEMTNKYIQGEITLEDGSPAFWQPWGTENLFQYGHAQEYNLEVRGGTDRFRYYVSGNYSDDEGYVYYNTDERARVRANLNLQLSDNLAFDLSSSFQNGFTQFDNPSGEGGPVVNYKAPIYQCVLGLQDMGPAQRYCPRTLGYWNQQPVDFIPPAGATRDFSRFVGGATLTHTFRDWLTQRAVFGFDGLWEKNEKYFPRHEEPTMPEQVDGTVWYATPIHRNMSLEYAATASNALSSALRLETSVGAQYYTRRYEALSTEGRDLATELSKTINQTPVERLVLDYAHTEERSLGLFVQEQVGFNDRIFVTGALRFDDNSAFGADFDALIYPKVSGTWVISEEPFWNLDAVSQLRLRAAWGQAGRQPPIFAARNRYRVIRSPDGGGGIAPIQPGNAEVGPEVSSELELGFDYSLFQDRLSGEFTYYTKSTKDALLSEGLPGSLGFPGSFMRNLGEIKGWGWEAMLNSRIFESRALSLDLQLNASYTMNEIMDLGSYPGTTEIRLGYPYPSVITPHKIVSAELDEHLQPMNVMCDAGVRTGPEDAIDQHRGFKAGGAVVPCDEVRNQTQWVGPAFHPYTVTVSPTVSMFENALQVFVMVDGKFGGWTHEGNNSFNGLTAGSRKHWLQDDSVWRAGMLQVGTFRDVTVDEFWRADFLKLREIGLQYQLPAALVARAGANRASLSLSGRDLLYLWRKNEFDPGGIAITDPERGMNTHTSTLDYYTGLPYASASATLRVSF
ncbi:MAG: SusC/RagA family TonB-linked outer membrane protein [Gemmatimonas sp.]|nr:SusC/RagA family TonB-linked outer membrane protein [Gemmatimonas sp.]